MCRFAYYNLEFHFIPVFSGTVAVLSLMMGALRYKHLPYDDLNGPPVVGTHHNNSSIYNTDTTVLETHYDFTPIELAVSTSLFVGVILVRFVTTLCLIFLSNKVNILFS